MKLSKWICIIVILVILGLGISFFAFNNSSKTKENADIVDIDCNGNNCEKIDDNKDNQSNDSKKNEDKDDKKNESDDNSSKNNVVPTPDTNTNTNTTPINNNSNTSVNTLPIAKETNNKPVPTVIEKIGDFIVSDDDHVWDNQTSLKMFNVSSIGPGDNGTYNFVVNNSSNRLTKYEIIFDEVNEYQANVLYKLKRNDKYVAGDKDTYVKYNALNLPEKELKSGEKDYYTIEWKWVDADNDTAVGRAASMYGATYTIKVTVNSMEAVEVDEYTPNTVDKIGTYVILAIVSIVGIGFIIIFLLINKKKRNK